MDTDDRLYKFPTGDRGRPPNLFCLESVIKRFLESKELGTSRQLTFDAFNKECCLFKET